MPVPSYPSYTRDDYSKLPDWAPRQQLIEGFLVEEPAPTIHHQDAVGFVYAEMRQYLRRNRIGRVFIAPHDVFLTDINVFQPDVCFVRKVSRHRIVQHGIEGPPDLVAEGLSPSTAKYDLGQKRRVYARTGVEEMWIVDPLYQSVSIFRFAVSQDKPVSILQMGDILATPILPGLSMPLKDIFEDLSA